MDKVPFSVPSPLLNEFIRFTSVTIELLLFLTVSAYLTPKKCFLKALQKESYYSGGYRTLLLKAEALRLFILNFSVASLIEFLRLLLKKLALLEDSRPLLPDTGVKPGGFKYLSFGLEPEGHLKSLSASSILLHPIQVYLS